ncbi:hypothetical protein [Companilactobacillus nantensis]|uniref:Uncharacterized protein n=1 Tax=Companilactobacillus nantensis DSM 16982 TaxID=1423774 RepID=A0A0R1WIP0_9LACO|nr:hypothetical protein [Companilactobacillus nantensis]KRM17453.1 hypothetical protein FD31_GL002643 [Companilactobacillus nantensis DSM 16982]GEO64424.1 hypothetical protein LNA01_16070 [Companilactobacillus nantensis]
MGMFTNNQKNSAENIYVKEVRPLLKKDGFTHVVMINSFSKWINQIFGAEDKYTTQIDGILLNMQKDGFEILDVKFDSLQNQGLMKDMEGFHTLVTYK